MRMPLMATIVAIAVVGSLYYAYYRNSVDYYTGRNMRLVSMLTAQVDGRVALHQNLLKNGGLNADLARPCAALPANEAEEPVRDIKELAGGWGVMLRDRDPTGKPVCAGIPFDEIVKPVFARRLDAAFDMLLVARSDGKVLYSVQTPPGASSLLTNSDEPSGDDASPGVKRSGGESLVIGSLGALTKKKGFNSREPLDPARLAEATAQTRVALGDAGYVFFSQPYTLGKSKLLVCGLVSARRFRYDVSAVSASVVLLAVALLLIAICCWPFLRIALIHPNQELAITDVVLIVLCTIVGAAVITLGLLDGFAYRRLTRQADEQLHDFSMKLAGTSKESGDFGKNIVRAMNALDAAEELTRPLPWTPGWKTQPFPESFKTDPRIGDYPYLTSFVWMDANGMQQRRYAAAGGTSLIDASERDYFRLARAGRSWTVGGREYILEWVRSKSTGEITAVVAKRTNDPSLPVAALATELIDISQAIRPPGVDFAIIDERGAVIYHSDPERIGYENFFTETDQNRELRSAVLARRATHVAASYWGDDKAMFVTPLPHSQWTLVTFRAKRLMRVLNVEAVLLALVLLLAVGTPYFVLYVVVLLVAPRYRAPSLWPDETRRGDYLRLCIIYLALLLLFVLNNYALTPWSSFYGAVAIPTLAILSTYLALHRTASLRRFVPAAVLWILAFAFIFQWYLSARLDASLALHAYRAVARPLLLLVAIAVAALTAMLVSDRPHRWVHWLRSVRVPIGYARLYRLCGVLLLLVGVAMPVGGFFRISRHVESELLVKYGQLRAAAGLEHRIDHLQRMNFRNDTTPGVLHDTHQYEISTIFGSRWSLTNPGQGPCPVPRSGDWTINPGAARFLPALYEDSIAIRPLFDAQSEDDLWHWCLDDGRIELVRQIRLDRAVAAKFPGGTPLLQALHVQSDLPEEKGGAEPDAAAVANATAGADEHSSGGPPWGAMLAAFAILLSGFWYAADFIATRILLIDVSEPYWLAHLPLSPTLGDHIFLVRRDQDAARLVGSDPEGFLEISFAKLQESDGWSGALEMLDSSAAGRNVRLTDFEYRINDGAVNEEKVKWLERLLALPDRTVIIISTVSPAYVMITPAPPSGAAGYYERWRALLDRFVTVTAEELDLRDQEWRRRKEFRSVSQQIRPRSWLEKETEYNSFLRRLRGELDESGEHQHLLDEIGERAETYYAGLWSSCREEEKLLLYQLAHNGLANGRNRRTLRRLIARGLVRRDPNLELFSETFRLYILAAARRENVVSRARAERGTSTWDALRAPFFIIIISFLLLLFATQKDLLTTTTALATALTTGLPMIMKLIGAFTERRLSAPDRV
jgi:hypothetical protein